MVSKTAQKKRNSGKNEQKMEETNCNVVKKIYEMIRQIDRKNS
jgi:hypothetical protein